MSQTLTHYSDLANQGSKKPVKASHLDGENLRADNDITVYRAQVPSDKTYWWGLGGQNRMSGNTAHIYADLIDGAGNQVEGDVIVAITDSDERVLAEREIGDVDTLAAAANDARTERPTMPALAPYATSDRYVEVRINADSGSDGNTLDPAASSMRLWYTTQG
jgi:hypothetical protein